MRCTISRSSGVIPPIEGATLQPYIWHDRRDVDDPSKLPYGWTPEYWYAHGKNHRVEDGRIVRDFEDHAWFIEIDSLEDLVELCARIEHPLVVNIHEGLVDVEIYDKE